MNAKRGEQSLEDRWQAAGKAVDYLGLAMRDMRSLAVLPYSFSVKAPTEEKPEFFMVVRGIDGEGRPVVAFHSSLELDTLFRGVEQRLLNGTLKWRDDEYA